MDAAPIEISAINSIWSVDSENCWFSITDDALFWLLIVGYIEQLLCGIPCSTRGSIQYPTGKPVEAASAKYIAQFIGKVRISWEWSRYLITFIAFLSLVLWLLSMVTHVLTKFLFVFLFNQKKNQTPLNAWMTLTSILGPLLLP